MTTPPDRRDRTFRRARFAVPPPAHDVADAFERIRLVDATGSAVAWLAYGSSLVVLGFFVRYADDGTWREIVRDRVIPVPGAEGCGAWSLVVRDPTAARLRCVASGYAFDVIAEINEGRLTILSGGNVLLRVGAHDSPSADVEPREPE